MNKSETIGKLAAALGKAQADMKAAPMNAINPFFKNHYADLGAIIEAGRVPLAANGLSYSQLTIGNAQEIGVTTILMHESGEWIETTITLDLGDTKGKSKAQEAGSIISYLRRYSLAACLGIYADEDTDGEKPGQQSTTRIPVAKPATKAPAEPVFPPVKSPQATMSLETAVAVPNRDGVLYGTLDRTTLAYMDTSLAKSLKAKDLDAGRREELEYKRAAIATIMAVSPAEVEAALKPVPQTA